MDNITKKVMNRIKEEKLVPESKTYSNIRKYSLWVPALVALVFGSFAASLIIYYLNNAELDLLCYSGGRYLLRSMPYFWIASLLLFLVVTNYSYRKTVLGHRRKISLIIGVYLLITIVFGLVFSYIGIPKYFQRIMSGNGFMHSIMFNQKSAWSHPEDGLLSGTIEGVNNNSIKIKDFDGRNWVIDTSDALIRKHATIEVGQQIKIIGTISNQVFVASEIRPWNGGVGQGNQFKMR